MCKYNDCGWCYAPKEVESNDDNGFCNNYPTCPYPLDTKPLSPPPPPKTFNFATEKINTVNDLRNWCDWLIEAGYEESVVGINSEYALSDFTTTQVVIKGVKSYVELT